MAACLIQTVSESMKYCVCNVAAEICMTGYSKSCPGRDRLASYLLGLDELEDEIEYMQWVSTDHTTLFRITQPLDEHVTILAGYNYMYYQFN